MRRQHIFGQVLTVGLDDQRGRLAELVARKGRGKGGVREQKTMLACPVVFTVGVAVALAAVAAGSVSEESTSAACSS